jgi:phosphinothricin acetyltransferase
METHAVIREAVASDAAAIAHIYNESVTGSTASFQAEPETEESRGVWLAEHDDTHPVIVAERAGEIVAWGALSPFRPREGWRLTVEDSVYVAAEHQRQGIGRLILTDLIARARLAGHHCIVAAISADQPASIALHAALGFMEAGRIREGGRKFDRWLDCVLMELIVG